MPLLPNHRCRVESPFETVFDALVEEHLAIQQLLIEMQDHDEPSGAVFDRLGRVFIAAAEALKRHTVPLAETPATRDVERGEAP